MPHWLIKALAQKALSCLPAGHTIHRFVQDRVSRSTYRLTDRFFEMKISQGQRHLEEYATVSGSASVPRTILELGTGWYPVIPVSFYLCGATRIWTIDRANLLRSSRIAEMLDLFLRYHREGRLVPLLPRMDVGLLAAMQSVASLPATTSVPKMLGSLGIEYIVGDARHLLLPDGCVDMVFSNLVLGFVVASALPGIMSECRRVIMPNGVMSHFVDMADLYALFDCRITPYNFLRFSERSWRVLNNDIQHLNRLRITDYHRMLQTAGFRIVKEQLDLGSIEELKTVSLAREFQAYSTEDLAVRNAWITAIPGA